MARVFIPRDEADTYTPNAGDTLEDIVGTNATCSEHSITWQELALFNWSTAEPAEVNRALIELIGCPLDGVDWANPERTRLDPAFSPNDVDSEILIPEPWTASDLPVERTHTIQIRRHHPMPAVRITRLSKWFIPETETCDISYNLEGVQNRADKLTWEVWANKYQTATLQASNPADADFQEFTFADCNDWIRQESIPDQNEPRPGSDYNYNEWDGQSQANNGVLAPRDGQNRYITVANSPYTVLFRFYKNDDHNDARILLDSFWPRWNEPAGASPPAPEVDPNSLIIKWKIENCSDLRHGQLLVWDREDDRANPVFRRALGPADLTEGPWHEFNWADGRDVVTQDRMPYRVQIQAHTGLDADEGIALAAMHTEVRIYAPPELDTHADPVEDPQCLDIELAPFLPDDSVIAAGDRKWYQYQLARIGLNPGAVTGENHDHYQIALKDFQRSYTKNASPPFERLTADGSENADTQNALNRVATIVASPPAGPPASPPSTDVARPLFGDRSQLNNPGRENITRARDIRARLNNPTQEMIVWIDDRHYYTESAEAPPDAAMQMEDYRGAMDIEDDRTQRDAESTARPWIPVCVGVPLLSKNDSLTRNTKPALTDAMRRATGPLRVDWTFRDIGEDLSVIDTSRYGGDRLRSRLFVETHVNNLMRTHADEPDQTNCPETYGGIRPTTGSPPEYYNKPFGVNALSLAPWRAGEDSTLRRVSTLFHDDMGQDADKVYPELVGKSGAYLCPSRIAGDGYQFRARVSFEQFNGGDYMYPNHEVLKGRYAKLPQANTCRLRNWRKTSYRAYIAWASPPEQRWNTRGNWNHETAVDYRSGFVHFAYEPGATNQVPIRSLFPSPPLQTAFVDLMENNSDAAFQGLSPPPVLADHYLWPWTNHPQLGVERAIPAGQSWADFQSWIQNNSYMQFSDEVILELIHQVERRLGRLRGHVLVEFRGSPDCRIGFYSCGGCNTISRYLERDAAGGAAGGRACPACGAAGIQHQELAEYTCTNCGNVERIVFNVGTSPANRNCGACGSPSNRTDGPNSTERVADSLINTALGMQLGGSFLITLSNNNDWPWWTHEIGHNRHFEHAAGEFGHKDDQHDSANNTHDAALQAAGDIGALWKRWDRVCTMSYTASRNPGGTSAAGDDRQQFCGKCLLRNRGWTVENLPDLSSSPPAGQPLGPSVQGP